MGAPGFDDAPIVTPACGTTPVPITFVYPYYENPRFLKFQIDGWNAYEPWLRENLHVIVVDDGSPNCPAADVLRHAHCFFNISLFRIKVDVRWNWLAARNIGMHHATGWCVLTDMDHLVPPETLHAVMFGEHDDKTIYRFSRREHDGRVIHPHPNSMLMSRETFWYVGGYDEALSGHYGTDGDWRRRCAAVCKIRTLSAYLIRHEFVQDSSTTRYLRKQPEDSAKKRIIAARGRNWRPKTLSFEYEKVIF